MKPDLMIYPMFALVLLTSVVLVRLFRARVVHAFVHMGRNRLRPRIAVYFASWIVLFAMWLVLVAGVAAGN
jgi:hypothetical protein